MRPILLAAGLLLCNLLTACAKSPELTTIEGFAQGTTYHLTFELTGATDKATLEQEVTAELQRIDASI